MTLGMRTRLWPLASYWEKTNITLTGTFARCSMQSTETINALPWSSKLTTAESGPDTAVVICNQTQGAVM